MGKFNESVEPKTLYNFINCVLENVLIRMKYLLAACFLLFSPSLTIAGKADVVDARSECNEQLVCRFTVTVQHADEGWDHYANAWEVLSLEGEVLGVRVLAHPHVHEQPFTRSLANVNISKGTKQVRIRAKDSAHGFGGKEIIINLSP